MALLAEEVRVPKAAALVAAHIRNQIVRGELHEDDPLPPEARLMEQFQVSRPTLREAFRILEHEGLITVRRGARGGARVRLPNPDIAARYAGLVLQYKGTTLADVFDARAILEPPAAAMLASRRDRVSISKQLAALLQEHRNAVVASETAPEFHRMVVELTGNETLSLMTRMLEYISEGASRHATETRATQTREANRAHKAHEKLVELIRAGDAEGAEDLWRRHLTEVGTILARWQGGKDTVLDVLE